MEIMILFWVLAVLFTVAGIGYKKGKEWDAKERKIEYLKGNSKQEDREKQLNQSFTERFIAPKIQFISDMANNKQSNPNAKKNSKYKTVEKQLRLAGMSMSADTYLFYKNAILFLSLAISIFLAIITKQFFILFVGLVIALLGPNMYLNGKASSNQTGIRNQLPDAMDLLCVCIESGLSFDAALLKVSEKMKGPFIDELLKLYRQIQMGVPRAEALREMASTSEIPELKTFMAALAQATQLGIPVNNIMKVQSEQLRETRMQQAREKGQKAPVKMLLPMIGLIFPVLFIVILSPVIINIMDMF